MTNNKKKNIVLAITAIFLFLALLNGWQYGFFTILRFVVFTTTAYVAYLVYQDKQEGWVWFMGAISVLFNPFIPIYLTREVWVVIDGLVGVFLFSSIFLLNLTRTNKDEQNSNES